MRNNFFKKMIAINYIAPNGFCYKDLEIAIPNTLQGKKKSSSKEQKQSYTIQAIDVQSTQIKKIDSLTKFLGSILKYQGVFESMSKSNDIFLIPIDFKNFPLLDFPIKMKKFFCNSFLACEKKPMYNHIFFSNISEFSANNEISDYNKITMHTCNFAHQKLFVPKLENITYRKQYTIQTRKIDAYGKLKKGLEPKQQIESYSDGKLNAHYQALTYNLEVSNLITLGTWLSIMKEFNPNDYQITDYEFRERFECLNMNKDYVLSKDFPIMKNIKWLDIVDFCNRLSISQGLEPCYDISSESNKTALSVSSNETWTNYIPNYVHINLFASGYRLPTVVELAMLDSFLKDIDQDVSILERNQTNKKLFFSKIKTSYGYEYDWSLSEFTNDFDLYEQIDRYLKTGWFHHKELALQELGLTNQNTLYDFFYYQWDVSSHPFLNSINNKLRDEVKDAYFKEVQDKNSFRHDILKTNYKHVKPNMISFSNKNKAYDMKETNYYVSLYQRYGTFFSSNIAKKDFFAKAVEYSDNPWVSLITRPSDLSSRHCFRVVRTIKN